MIFTCFVKPTEHWNKASHSPHENVCSSPLWILLWAVNCFNSLKRAVHSVQEKRVSPLCAFKWDFKLKDLLNFAPHSLHRKGFTPLWTASKWNLKLPQLLKERAHSLQEKGLSSEWVVMWCFSVCDNLKGALQSLHLKRFSPVWIRLWCWSDYRKSQKPHKQTGISRNGGEEIH